MEHAVENPADPQAEDHRRDELAASPQAKRHRRAGGARIRLGVGRWLGRGAEGGPTFQFALTVDRAARAARRTRRRDLRGPNSWGQALAGTKQTSAPCSRRAGLPCPHLASKGQAPLARLDPRGPPRARQASSGPEWPSHAQVAAPAESRQGSRNAQGAASGANRQGGWTAKVTATARIWSASREGLDRLFGHICASAASPCGSGPHGRGLRPVAARRRHPRSDAPLDRLECRGVGVPHHDRAHGHRPEAGGARVVEARGREPVGAGGPRHCRVARRDRRNRVGAWTRQDHGRLGEGRPSGAGRPDGA